MKKYAMIVLAILLALTVSSTVCGMEFDNETILGLNVTTDVDDAFKESQNLNKSVALVFDQDSCVYCDMLKQDTLSNADVQSELNENYIVVLVDINKNHDIASQYQIFGTPSIQFLDGDGNDIGKIEGYLDSDEFLDELREI